MSNLMIETKNLLERCIARSMKPMLLAGILAGGVLVLPLRAQSPSPAATPAPAAKPVAAAGAPTRYQPSRFPRRAAAYYGLYWGVDGMVVKTAESGELIRFSYHVLDAEKAKMLNDKKYDPLLVSPAAGIQLVIPSLEKVGQLRQSSTPEAGRSYWMAFSNPGRRVKKGDRVDVVIGQFRAEGLVVE
jgi:hypothetical protein